MFQLCNIYSAMGINAIFNSDTGLVQTSTGNGAGSFKVESPAIFAGAVNLGSSATIANAMGIAPFKLNTTALTVSTTLSVAQAGVITLSGSTGALAATLPPVGTSGGATFIIKSISNHAHIVSASIGDGSAIASSNTMYLSGTKYTMQGEIGAAIILQSDTTQWCVLSKIKSGSFDL